MNPGQVTDDSELAMCLMHGLTETKEASTLDIDAVLGWYKKWGGSKPFDATETVTGTLMLEDASTVEEVRKAAAKLEADDKSILMLLAPLAVWTAGVEDVGVHRALINAHSSLTHADPLARDAAFVYCRAIAFLLNHRNEPNKARDAINHVLAFGNSDNAEKVEPEVIEWLEIAMQMWVKADDKAAVASLDVRTNDTLIMPIFVMAFYFLLRGSSYEAAIRATISQGGDADTNAAVVGALVGAALGVD
jgi:ADP-ribosyl-[dinitrogen reductase] hydrolase